MSRQHELRRDLHFTVAVVLEGGKVAFVFVGIDLLPVFVVRCKEERKVGEESLLVVSNYSFKIRMNSNQTDIIQAQSFLAI